MEEVDVLALEKRSVLILGGGVAGLAAVRELRESFNVILVDAKEYFEFTPGILRAYVKPEHWDSLVFPYQQVLESRCKVTFKCGEVLELKSEELCARVQMLWAAPEEVEVIRYHFCLISAGCNFNQLSRHGVSPWFPVIHRRCRDSALDERFLEHRRRRILMEHEALNELNSRKASVLVVGAGYQGVQWACELKYFFPELRLFLADFMPRCLGPLPEEAAAYCEDYMQRQGITTQYNVKYDEKSSAFWRRLGLPGRADKTYVLSGAKHTNFFLPESALSQRGPGGGGWILVNKFLQVVSKGEERLGEGTVFAAGDCVSSDGKWELPQVPKTGFPAEQQAIQACRNIRALDRRWFAPRCLGCVPTQHFCGPRSLRPTWFPWAAGIFAVSLGPKDGVIIVGARFEKGLGRVKCRGALAAALKDLIEVTKVASSRQDHWLSCALWHWLHHMPAICG